MALYSRKVNPRRVYGIKKLERRVAFKLEHYGLHGDVSPDRGVKIRELLLNLMSDLKFREDQLTTIKIESHFVDFDIKCVYDNAVISVYQANLGEEPKD